MKANELRIGNYTDWNGSDRIVQSIDEWEIGEDTVLGRYYFPIIEVNGIPLTEEWLLKFGFEWRNTERDYFKEPYSIALFNSGIISFYHEDGESCVELNDELKYVHQLQNLYFALTGEELTIK